MNWKSSCFTFSATNMASSSTNANTSFHARSNSLPSRPHPLISEADDLFCRLRDSISPSSSFSSSSIGHKLNDLQDLHDCIDKLLQMKFSTAQKGHQKWVDELLDGSLRLLDVSSIAKDSLSQMKQCVIELQCVIRRRIGIEIGVACQVRKYLTTRKMMKKAIQRALKNLKKCNFSSIEKTDNEIVSLIRTLREVVMTTSVVLKSLLIFISGSNPSHWSLVSRIIHSKRVECEEDEVNEFAMVDTALESIIGCKYDNVKINESAQNHLKNLELCIQDLEEGTESLFRCMIRMRVSLLNIFNYKFM